ncbi:MAG: ribonuclease D [Pseudohongiella sp.]|nr:ribonuclease D [Pseudohongiella sp.]
MSVDLELELVSDNSRLNELCMHWMTREIIALDTEFMRVSTFYPKAGLVQVGDRGKNYLLDPLALTDWRSFLAVLQCPTVTKVLHSCSEDLVLFYSIFKCIPAPLFDTQRAAAFLGYGFSISYLNLVLKLLNIVLEKGETRSDWLQRPLSAQQLKYAALDVAYLPEVHRLLKAQLEQKSFLEFFEADCARLSDSTIQAENEAGWQDIYLSMGASWRLNRQQLGALKPLCVWREQVARARDKPRSWIARDADLMQLVEKMPVDRQALTQLKDMSRNLYQQDAEQVLEIIAGSSPVSQHDADLVEGLPLTQAQRALLKRCQQQVEQVSAQTGIAVELLARKKLLVQLLHLNPPGGTQTALKWPASMASTWQRVLLVDALTEVLIHGK